MKKILICMSLFAFASVAFGDKPIAPMMSQKMGVTGVVNWTGYGVGKSHNGDINIKSGMVEMKGPRLVSGNFILDMTSLKTSDSSKLQAHLRSADFFDVEKFGEAQFKITKVEEIKNSGNGPNHKIFGELTIKGKTNPEEFLATITKSGAGFVAAAETEIKDRTKYDIVYNSGKFKAASLLGDKLINDNIKVRMELKTN